MGMTDWTVGQVRRRTECGGGGSVESTLRARFWSLASVVDFFGTVDAPREGRYFAEPHMCVYDLRDPAEPTKLYRKPLRLAATFK